MQNSRRSRALWAGLVAAMLTGSAHAQTNTLITGKRITQPALGVNTNVGSLPMNLVTTPDGKFAVVTDMGFHEQLTVVRTADGAVTSALPLGDSTLSVNPDGLYYGVAVTDNGDGTSTVYAARGAATNADGTQPGVGVYSLDAGGVLSHTADISVRHGDFPAGLALSPDGKYLYVAVNEYFALTSTPAQAFPDVLGNLTGPGQVVVYSAGTGAELGRVTLSSPYSGKTFSSFPLAVAAVAGKVYVTSQRDGLVCVVNAANPAQPTQSGMVQTGAHPAGLTLSRAGTRLYVANAHSDTISVIDTNSDTVVDTILVRPTGTEMVPGATPLGLSLSPDEGTLYAALGDMNAVAVISLRGTHGQLTGYIPTGWYPTAVAPTPYRRLLVTNAKGIKALYPSPGFRLGIGSNKVPDYDLNQITGTAQLLPLPNAVTQTAETQQVLANNRIAAITSPQNPLPAAALAGIKHVIYVIKENRTYDQVLGDAPNGNGDPSLALFGKAVTPNQHALASRFVLLDNFYDCGEGSGDGWPWSTQGMATEYVIKNLPYNYSHRGRSYDFEGQNNSYLVAGIPGAAAGGVVALGPHGSPLMNPRSPFAKTGGPAIPDVSEAPGRPGASGGHIWDAVKDAGLSYRNYGFFLSGSDAPTPTTPGTIPDNYPTVKGLRPAGFVGPGTGGAAADFSQMGVSDTDYRDFDGNYADSDAPTVDNSLYPVATYGFYNQPSRFSEFNREFQLMLAQGRQDNKADPSQPIDKYVPRFLMVRFPHDHTDGYNPGVHSAPAEVADNDYAVGQLVQAVSSSAIWNSAAIFVIEDDAQNGPDHVDAHRSTCFVISPWIKQNSVDHTFYNTDSVLHSMELLLGVAPMNQYDAVATPILDFDTSPVNSAPYSATLPDAGIIGEITPTSASLPLTDPRRRLMALSAKMDFVHPDSAPADLLNEVLWKSIKGVNSVMPAPRHTLEPAQAGTKKAAKAVVRDND